MNFIYVIYRWKTLSLGDITCARYFSNEEDADKWISDHEGDGCVIIISKARTY